MMTYDDIFEILDEFERRRGMSYWPSYNYVTDEESFISTAKEDN